MPWTPWLSSLLLLVSLVHDSVRVSAQLTNPWHTRQKRDSKCVMRGICGQDGKLRQNCPYDGPPIPVNVSTEEVYRQLCPRLFDGRLNSILPVQMPTVQMAILLCAVTSSNSKSSVSK